MPKGTCEIVKGGNKMEIKTEKKDLLIDKEIKSFLKETNDLLLESRNFDFFAKYNILHALVVVTYGKNQMW